MKRRSAFVIGAIVALVIGLGAGAAYGYFTSHGTGTGSSSTGTMQTVTISATAGSPNTPLLPGGTGDVAFNVTNPNNFTVSLVGVSLKSGGTITADSGHSSCTTTGVTLSIPSGDLPQTIPANTTWPVDLPGAASMSTTSLNACQGASFSIPVTITVEK